MNLENNHPFIENPTSKIMRHKFVSCFLKQGKMIVCNPYLYPEPTSIPVEFEVIRKDGLYCRLKIRFLGQSYYGSFRKDQYDPNYMCIIMHKARKR